LNSNFKLSIATLLLINTATFISCSPLKKYNPGDRSWALREISTFEKRDKSTNYPEGAILFIGSSSIRLWKTLKEDMAPFPVIQRGYGGAHFRDMVFFTDRILADHNLSMVVCFVANDISGSPKDGSPKEVLKLFKLFVKQVRDEHPEIPILQIAVTPTISRWKYWKDIKKLNKLIDSYCKNTENLHFIDTVPTFLNADGQPKSELFVKDQLHLNTKGYEAWNSMIKSEIERINRLN
jgi:hypothetical protein